MPAFGDAAAGARRCTALLALAALPAGCTAARDATSDAQAAPQGATAPARPAPGPDTVALMVRDVRVVDSAITIAQWTAAHPGDSVVIRIDPDSLPWCAAMNRGSDGMALRVDFVIPAYQPGAKLPPVTPTETLARQSCVAGAATVTGAAGSVEAVKTLHSRLYVAALQWGLRDYPVTVWLLSKPFLQDRRALFDQNRRVVVEADTGQRFARFTYFDAARMGDAVHEAHAEVEPSEKTRFRAHILESALELSGVEKGLASSVRNTLMINRGVFEESARDPAEEMMITHLTGMLLLAAVPLKGEQRAAALLAAGLALEPFRFHFAIDGPFVRSDAARDSIRSLSPNAFAATGGPDSILKYTGDLGGEALKIDSTGRVADLHLLSILGNEGFANGKDDWEDIIALGEPLLKRLKDPQELAYVHLLVGEAYRDIVALRDNGEHPPSDAVSSAEARARAIRHYQQVIDLDPGSERARSAWSDGWGLAAGLSPKYARHYFYD